MQTYRITYTYRKGNKRKGRSKEFTAINEHEAVTILHRIHPGVKILNIRPKRETIKDNGYI